MSGPNGLVVVIEADCGNAPKKARVRDWLISLAQGDIDAVCGEFDEGVRWDAAGDRCYRGIDAVRSYVARLTEEQTTHLSIHHLLSHGKQVAVEGATNLERFAHVVTFTGHGKTAKLAEVVSYSTPTTD